MRRKGFFWIVYGAVAVILAVIIYLVPSIKNIMESTYVLEEGDLEIYDDVSGVVVRNETVYVSAEASSINRLSDEALLVKVGANVVELSGSGNEEAATKYDDILSSLGDSVVQTSGSTTMGGYVVYDVDGLESALKEDTLSDIDESTISSAQSSSTVETQSSKCAAGEPLFKIVENGDYWLVFFIDSDDAEKYTVGREVTLDFEGSESGTDIRAFVKSVEEQDDKTKIVIWSNEFFDDYLTLRGAEVKVTTASVSGLIIKNSSIVEIDDQQGVIVKDKLGDNYFMPIKIKATNGDESAIYADIYTDENSEFVETVSIYDEVLRSPSQEDIEALTSDSE